MAAPVLMYGIESRTLTKIRENKLKLLKFLRGVKGYTLRYHITNAHKARALYIYFISDKIKRNKENWIQHINTKNV